MLIQFAADRNPDKWRSETIGTHIPIISEEDRGLAPDYYLVLPWHFLDEFLERESDFFARGGQFIIPLPDVHLIDAAEREPGTSRLAPAPAGEGYGGTAIGSECGGSARSYAPAGARGARVGRVCLSRSTRGDTTSRSGRPIRTFTGDCLDVSGPKLLTSLLQAEGNGTWLGIDLFDAEIDAWRRIDPALRLRGPGRHDAPLCRRVFRPRACVHLRARAYRSRRRREGSPGRNVARAQARRCPAPDDRRLERAQGRLRG